MEAQAQGKNTFCHGLTFEAFLEMCKLGSQDISGEESFWKYSQHLTNASNFTHWRKAAFLLKYAKYANMQEARQGGKL